MQGYFISGDISKEQLEEALSKAFPSKKVSLSNSNQINRDANEICISDFHMDEFQQAKSQLELKENELKASEASAGKAILTIHTLQKQQQALFDEFVILRERYDDQKNSLINILWNHCAKYHPELRQIPNIEDHDTFVETNEKIGNLNVGELLGEGQFATVKCCTIENKEGEYALKIIKKERINTFTSLMRVSNEIDNLKLLKSPYIVSVVEVLHTQNMLYIVTEKGGSDLFEFFDEHQNGVQENWAREIILSILKGVLYCHDQGICHRDLKPENILVTFDYQNERCIDLKLCDFGLSTKFKSKVLLTDFCGSPGFFAPEMISHGAYFGDKADVWSVGCILLELILGHERFCDIWMIAYDYEVLQDKATFTSTITETVDQLPDFLKFSDDLNDFVLKFLELRSSRRPNIRQLSLHPWLRGLMEEDAKKSSIKMANGETRPWSPPGLSPSPSVSVASQFLGKDISEELVQKAYSGMSEKERRQMENYILSHQQTGDHDVIHLPPIMPATPSITHAKKLLKKHNSAGSDDGSLFVDDLSSPVLNFNFHTPHNRSPLPSVAEVSLEDSTNEAKRLVEDNNPTTPQQSKVLLVSQSESSVYRQA